MRREKRRVKINNVGFVWQEMEVLNQSARRVIIAGMNLTQLRAAWSALIDRQHRLPQGFLGRLIGERMLRQHAIETAWSVQLLDLAPQDRVLELGSGAGRGLQLALAQVTAGQVVGLDLSPTMIRSARRRLGRSARSRQAALLCADILALPLRSGSFDKIFSIHTFYFWQQSKDALAQLYHLLSPQGRLVLCIATAKKDSRGRWVVWPLQATLEQEILPGLTALGFHDARLERGPDSRDYNNMAVIADR